MSIAVEIADSLAAALTSHTFSVPFVASRKYVPDYDRPDLEELRVSVVPGPAETERVSRGQDLFTHSIMVIVAKATDGSNGQVDPLMQLCEEIIDVIRGNTISAMMMPEEAKYFSSSFQTMFDRDTLGDHRVFTAQIEVTYRVPRQNSGV
jgi:hypothetical protein